MTNMRRGAIRVAVAGAMVTLPLAAVAATASAETPAADGVQVQEVSEGVVLEGGDVSRPHPGPDGFPGRPGPDGPRVEFRGPDHDFPGPGPRIFRQALPPTGSFGSS
ncbi:hypothetical protein [Nocardia sp. NPDC050793]|uniref:hypothetical protein n=1 Tax=Nocardia sp. NPDC050793 TaxID=3155159 RepID=UPI0033FD621A